MLGFLKALYKRYSEDEIAGRAAALSYFTIFSIGPLLFIIFGVLGKLLQSETYRQKLIEQMESLVGPQAGTLINDVIQNQTLSSKTGAAFFIGTVGLILGAIGIFGQLQKSIDALLHVKTGPDAGFAPVFKQKLLSLGLVGAIVFLLMVSLVASALIPSSGGSGPGQLSGAIYTGADFLLSTVVLSALFMLLYRTLPEVKLPWGLLFKTSLIVALLFAVGKVVLGLIIGNNANITAFGAAGSLIALLLWIFYSGQIVYLGAAGMALYVERHNLSMEPRYKGKRGVMRWWRVEEPVQKTLPEKLVDKFAKGLTDGLKKNRIK